MVTAFYNIKALPFFFSFLILLLPFTNPISFQIKNFDLNKTRIIYEGGARSIAGAIEFSDVNYMCQTGRATYADKIPIWNSKTNQLTDFTSHFSFYIDIQGRNQYGSGLVFFLAPVGSYIPLNSCGGFLGLYNLTNIGSALNQMLHIEFDSYFNREWDPTFLHVGINYNSLQSAIFTHWNASFHSGDPADVWIAYNSKTQNLSVSWKYRTTSIPQENTSLSLIIDLRQILPEWVIIGFTASTSNRIERHVVQSWNFDSSLEIHEEKETYNKKIKTIQAVVISGGVLLIAMAAFGIFWIRKRQRRKETEKLNLKSINIEFEKGAGARIFSYKDLVKATGNFSSVKKLGKGGFGSVYKAYLGTTVAVKKFSKGSEQGKQDYMTEVKIISQLKHKNLVKLLGWSHDGSEFLLVYEFMSNGSLDSHLFKKKFPLTWTARYKIALGLANALLYLHEEWEKCVLHRDIKSSNIMLDSSFNARLGDFGLAKLIEHELGQETTKVAAGTIGYMAPEYISTRKASKESDVYSFGIVLLEIVTGKNMLEHIKHNNEEMNLVEWIWYLYGSKNLRMGVDEILEMDFDENQMKCLMIVGLWCAHSDKSIRPSIRKAIQVLKFEAPLPNLDTRLAVPVYCALTPKENVVSSSFCPDENLMSHSSYGVGR